MAEPGRRVAVLVLLLSVLAATGCAGVPNSGAVHRQDLPANQPAVAGLGLVAQGPQPHQNQTEVVDSLLRAMNQDDTNVVQQFLTPDYADQWQTTFGSRTIVYSTRKGPTLTNTNTSVSVGLTQTGVIDDSGTFDATTPEVAVKFTMVKSQDTWQVSDISQPGLFVQQDALPDFLTPWHVYFPSSAATSTLPRLVPDTIYLPPGSSPYVLIGQLLDGPSEWVKPSIYVIVKPSTKNRVNQVTPNTRSSVTTVDLHLNLPANHPLSAARLEILKAQIAYTLNVQSFHTGSVQLLLDGAPQGDPYSLSQLPSGFDPDVLPVQAPVYYLSSQGQVVASTRAPQNTPAGSGVPAAAAADTTETVLEHAEGVRQLAVATPTDVDGVETQMLAGVRTQAGIPTLVLATANDPAADPWHPVVLTGATSLSTPSFDVTGTGVWTVGRAADGSSTIYRVPLVGQAAGSPEAVEVSQPEGVSRSVVTSLKLSRDGSKAALVVNSQAYVGVVNHPDPPGSTVWSITSLRPAIGLGTGDTDADVFWADQTELGVLVRHQEPVSDTKPQQYVTTTQVYRVSSDGYTVSSDGSIGPVLVDGAPTGENVEIAGGPRQPWVASAGGQLSRQPTTDSSTDSTSPAQTAWSAIGTGSWPTYAG